MMAQGADLGVLKLTVQQFFRVSGSSTQWKGVTPDILLPDPVGHLDTGERELKNSIPWSSIEAVPHGTWTPTWRTEVLAGKSAARVAKSEVLAKIAARAELLRQRRADTRLPLQKTAWTALRSKQREALEATSPELDEGPARFAVTPIDEHPAAAAPGPGGRTDDRGTRWRDNVSRDPWIEEALAIAADMTAPAAK
jgi:carboxyl-terminal processing protease